MREKTNPLSHKIPDGSGYISQSISLTDLRMPCRGELHREPSHERCHGLHPD